MCHWSATKVHDVTLLTVVLKSEEKQKHTGLLTPERPGIEILIKKQFW